MKLSELDQKVLESVVDIAMKYIQSEKTGELKLSTALTICSGYLSFYNLNMEYEGRLNKKLSSSYH